MLKKKFICNCYLTNNIFLKPYNLHVTYKSEKLFWDTYGQVLKNSGCNGEQEREDVKKIISEEINRRLSNGKESRWRKDLIAKTYNPLHRDVYSLQESYLHNDFLSIVKYAKEASANKDDLMKMLTCLKGQQVYKLPVFTAEFCNLFLEEIKHFLESDLPKGRPNSMNTSGVLLEELGFYPDFLDKLRAEYLSPIASLLFPDWIGESGLDSQRAFIVYYDFNKDGDNSDLNTHFDNAEVTFNVSLNENFKGGDLFLGGMHKAPKSKFTQELHQATYGLLHRARQLHGAMPLESGERYNLIIWMRSSSIRNELCPMCDYSPSLVETEGDGDGFTAGNIVDVCTLA